MIFLFRRFRGSWSSKEEDVNQWIQVEFVQFSKVTAIQTQGRDQCCQGQQDQWVTSYKISYSSDGQSWSVYENNDGAQMVSGIFQNLSLNRKYTIIYLDIIL